jgi:hypothetical protein
VKPSLSDQVNIIQALLTNRMAEVIAMGRPRPVAYYTRTVENQLNGWKVFGHEIDKLFDLVKKQLKDKGYAVHGTYFEYPATSPAKRQQPVATQQ